MNLQKGVRHLSTAAVLFFLSFSSALAGEVALPNTFQSGTPAVAAEVNANFSAVKTAVDDNDSRIAAMQNTIDTLLATVADQAAAISELQAFVVDQARALLIVQRSSVMALEPYLTVDEDTDPRGTLVQLAGVNLQLVNGLGSTSTVNGLGNLIVGYDEQQTSDTYMQCSDGKYSEQSGCENAGGTWGYSFKSGSHYLVLGAQNNYSQYGGLVAGFRNFSTRDLASVTGGIGNSARGLYSNVNGGSGGIASGNYSSVNGGYENDAIGSYSSVQGGLSNESIGQYSSINGGYVNQTFGIGSSILGGRANAASGSYSSVSGGWNNTASGTQSSVSGGETTAATGQDDWAAASLYEDD